MFRIFVVGFLVFFLTCTFAGAADFSGYLQTDGQIEDKKLNFALRKLSLTISDANFAIGTGWQESWQLTQANLSILCWNQKFTVGKFFAPIGQFPPANKSVSLEYPKANIFPFETGIGLSGKIGGFNYRLAATEGETTKNFSGRLTYKCQIAFLTAALSGQVKLGREKNFTRHIYGGDAILQTKLVSFSGGYNYLREKEIKKAWWMLAAMPVDNLTLFSQLQGWRTDEENEVDLTVGANFLLSEKLLLRHNIIFPVKTKKAPTRILLALQREF